MTVTLKDVDDATTLWSARIEPRSCCAVVHGWPRGRSQNLRRRHERGLLSPG